MATVRTERSRARKHRVPDLSGLHERDARLVLRHRGFFDPNLIGTPREGEPRVDVRYAKNAAPFGTVVEQSPTRGQIADSDAVIRLTVSMESLADYLPGLYRRRQLDGSNFVREFLWIFQHIFYSLESKIETIHDYFEIFETPEEFLPWLAGWVAFSLDGEWSEAERRLFLKRAVELYRLRGTVRGLRTFIEMYTGVRPEIIENAWPLDGFQIGVASTVGVDTAILPLINRAHCFIVEVPLDPETVEDDVIIKVHQIITQEKPAHTTYYLRFTGEAEALSRWTGPVIGEYMVAPAAVPVVRGETSGETGEATGEAPAKEAKEEEAKEEEAKGAKGRRSKSRRKGRKSGEE